MGSVILRRSRRIWPADETFLPFVGQILHCALFRMTDRARINQNPYEFPASAENTRWILARPGGRSAGWQRQARLGDGRVAVILVVPCRGRERPRIAGRMPCATTFCGVRVAASRPKALGMAVAPACLWRAPDTDPAAIPTLRVRRPPEPALNACTQRRTRNAAMAAQTPQSSVAHRMPATQQAIAKTFGLDDATRHSRPAATRRRETFYIGIGMSP